MDSAIYQHALYNKKSSANVHITELKGTVRDIPLFGGLIRYSSSETAEAASMLGTQTSAFMGPEYASVEEFVKARGGYFSIKKVLIANNGLAATKAIRSIRRWAQKAFGAEDTIKFVAMATPEDIRANAEYIRLADELVEAPGGPNYNNYANVMFITRTAFRIRADAVWAGWGHASENPALPEALARESAEVGHQVQWIGPPPSAMRALGDKISSTLIAQTAGVPCLGWNGETIRLDYAKDCPDGIIPEDLYRRACVSSAEEATEVCARIGLPVMIKASEGGGGKGIRKVINSVDVASSFRQVQAEVPGSPIFIMKLATRARHLEVQLLGDMHGNAIALSGRDCSIQRRHQKVIEEGPITAAPPHVWKKMEDAAISLAKAVGYVGAGTVEYLYMEGADDKRPEERFCFLELNPRLQVEHPVTEWITRMNIPSLQLQVAMGIPLFAIPEIRDMFGQDRALAIPIPEGIKPGDNRMVELCDVDWNKQRSPEGHVIAVRVTAENAENGFTPTSGQISELTFRTAPQVWGYFAIGLHGKVHEYADSQIGHLFAWGTNREEARRRMIMALRELSIRGEIRTTVEYIIGVIQTEDFVNNKYDTQWLEKVMAANKLPHTEIPSEKRLIRNRPSGLIAALVGAIVTTQKKFVSRNREYVEALQRGQVPHSALLSCTADAILIYEDVKYRFTVSRTSDEGYTACLQDNPSVWTRAKVIVLEDGGLLIAFLGGRSHIAYSQEEASGVRLTFDGMTFVFTEEADPQTLKTTVPGKLVKFLVSDGDHVEKGTAVAEIEVMKMIVTLCAEEAGIVTVAKSEGSNLDAGDVIARLELDDPSQVKSIETYSGEFDIPETYGVESIQGGVYDKRYFDTLDKHEQLREASGFLHSAAKGFAVRPPVIQACLDIIRRVAQEPIVPVLSLVENISSLISRLPESFVKDINAAISMLRPKAQDGEDVSIELVTILSSLIRNLPSDKTSIADPLLEWSERYRSGIRGRRNAIYTSILREYLDTERVFERKADKARVSEREIIAHFFEERGEAAAVALARAQEGSKSRSKLVIALLRDLFAEREVEKSDSAPPSPSSTSSANTKTSRMSNSATSIMGPFTNIIQELALLSQPSAYLVAMECRQLLIYQQVPSFIDRLKSVADLLAFATQHNYDGPSAMVQSPTTGILSSSPQLPPSIPEEAQSVEAARHAIDSLINRSDPIFDVLIPLYFHWNLEIRRLAMEIYVRRSYTAYEVSDLHIETFYRASSEEESGHTFDSSDRDNLSVMDLLAPSETETFAVCRWKFRPTQRAAPLRVDLSCGDSYDDLRSFYHEALETRQGSLVAFATFDSFITNFDTTLRVLVLGEEESGQDATLDDDERSMNVLNIALHIDNREGKVKKHESLYKGSTVSCPNTDKEWSSLFSSLLQDFKGLLLAGGIRRVTFTVSSCQLYPDGPRGGQPYNRTGYFTFKSRFNFEEDLIYRHIDPPLAYHLEIKRLQNYNVSLVPTTNRQVHLYYAIPQLPTQGTKQLPPRYFVRLLVRHLYSIDLPTPEGKTMIYPEPERVFVEGLNALEIAMEARKRVNPSATAALGNHIFLNILPQGVVGPKGVKKVLKDLSKKYEDRLRRLNVTTVELRMNAQVSKGSPTVPMRLVATERVQGMVKVDAYVEVKDLTTGKTVFSTMEDTESEGALAIGNGDCTLEPSLSETSVPAKFSQQLDGHDISTPYTLPDHLVAKRAIASQLDTTYVYDYLELFAYCLHQRWKNWAGVFFHGFGNRNAVGRSKNDAILRMIPEIVCESTELVLDGELKGSPRSIRKGDTLKDVASHFGLAPVRRPPGNNKIGMVAWLIRLVTPEVPTGRRVIVIANDITMSGGSFGPSEDDLFYRATELARYLEVPRIYLAANSGARIGLADEVKSKLKVQWNDNDPSKGIQYLYLSKDDGVSLEKGGSVAGGLFYDNQADEERYKLSYVVGLNHGLGVENLKGSGAIAGITSRANKDIVTLSYIGARSVGIGAYLVRLGQRTIQHVGHPILLTGYTALNSVLGQELYTSNMQLGGPNIMYRNGVSHLTADSDIDAISRILQWISYIPECRRSRLPVFPSSLSVTGTSSQDVDRVDRHVACTPKSGEDIRDCLRGVRDPSTGEFLGGFLDRDSFFETLSGWAHGVVVGRGRLGGIPIGVIAVETRSTSKVVPADPADLESKKTTMARAGQVWYPDSAFKTAQAIQDFKTEDLPLMIFANWRGFSGGTRDMFDEILKFGSYIVDALRDYEQPVFVYIPPGAELRGGAWVVVDPSINSDCMEMYADPTSRGGVLEPEGIVEIKYRDKDLKTTMHRLDKRLQEMDAELDTMGDSDRDTKISAIKSEIVERERTLLPYYRQMAVAFADMHDRAGRMKAKNVIEGIVPWAESRLFFCRRLRRRLSEMELVRRFLETKPDLTVAEANRALRSMFCSDRKAEKEKEKEKRSARAKTLKALGIIPRMRSSSGSDKSEEEDEKLIAEMSEEWKDDDIVLKWLARSDVKERLGAYLEEVVSLQMRQHCHDHLELVVKACAEEIKARSLGGRVEELAKELQELLHNKQL